MSSLDKTNKENQEAMPSHHLSNDEFKYKPELFSDPKSRRTFLKLMGASLALGGLSGCSIRKPKQKMTPYVKEPEHHISGMPDYYATTLQNNEIVMGVLAETYEGRPTKIEGNPQHPHSNGRTNLFSQASVLNLYDPDRCKAIELDEKQFSKKQFEDFFNKVVKSNLSSSRSLICIPNTLSPTQLNLINNLQKKYKRLRILKCASLGTEHERQSTASLYPHSFTQIPHLDKAACLVSFDSDFLGSQSKSIAYQQDFFKNRDPENPKKFNRLYQFESDLTETGSVADNRIASSRENIEASLAYISLTILKKTKQLDLLEKQDIVFLKNYSKKRSEKHITFCKYLLKDLLKNKGKSILICGNHLPVWAQQLTLLANQCLGNINKTVSFYKPTWTTSKLHQSSSKQQLEAILKENKAFDFIFVLGCNPVYDFGNYADVKTLFKQAKHRIHLTEIINDTSHLCQWYLPQENALESWCDYEALDGTYSVAQPMINPLYDAYSTIDFLNLMLGHNQDSFSTVKTHFKKRTKSLSSWDKTIESGIYPYKKRKIKALQPTKTTLIDTSFAANKPLLLVKGDPKTNSGKQINNAWLQEVPDSITKLCWDNALVVNANDAKKKGWKTGDVVKLKTSHGSLEIPIQAIPGIAYDSYICTIGYGQHIRGKIGNKVGFNILPICDTASNTTEILSINKTDKTYTLAQTQEGFSQHNRNFYREKTLKHYKKHPNTFVHHGHFPLKSLWKEVKYSGEYQWGMMVDLSKCTGCNTCVIACQAENNIPIVGKEQILKGRDMHWLRIDRYIEEKDDSLKVGSMPLSCAHCELAPCEQVCPVNATVHDDEGLNLMVYNRCIGTRYCANNCPYKVRRFNYFDWHQVGPHAEKNTDKEHLFDHPKRPPKGYRMQFNPDVTVRMRGVMEKCTYCIQTIKKVSIHAKNEGRKIRDQEIQTACQKACPVEGIYFGDISDETTLVSEKRRNKRRYALLEELNIKPRTQYLGAIKNPNKYLVHEKEDSHAHH